MRLVTCIAAASLLSAASFAPAHAADGGYWDFRFGVGAEPPLRNAKYEPDGSYSYESDWDAGGGSIEFNASHRFSARGPNSAFITFGAFVRGFDGPDDPDFGNNVELGIAGIAAGGGWSYKASERYSLELGPRLAVGTASATETYAGSQADSDTGGYARLDVGVANLFNFGKFQLAATVGVASWAAVVPYPAQNVNSPTLGVGYFPGGDVTYSGAGPYLSVMLGFR